MLHKKKYKNSSSYDGDRLKELLTLSQKGNKEKYKEFLTSILPIIQSMTYNKVFDPQDASDVIQEILLSIHKSLPTFDHKRDVMPWLKTIANRRIIDYIRKITKKSANEQLTDDGDVTNFESHANIELEDLKVLDELPIDTKKAILLTKLEGYSTREAAKILGIKENALRTKISRGLAKIKKNNKEELQ